MADDEAAMGPISYLIVEFPGNKMTGEGFASLVDLVDRGVIRILDLVFVTRGDDGSMRALELRDLDSDGSSTWRSSRARRRGCSTSPISTTRPRDRAGLVGRRS